MNRMTNKGTITQIARTTGFVSRFCSTGGNGDYAEAMDSLVVLNRSQLPIASMASMTSRLRVCLWNGGLKIRGIFTFESRQVGT